MTQHFLEDLFRANDSRRVRPSRYPKFPSFREKKMQLARCGSHILRWLMQIGRDPLPERQANADSVAATPNVGAARPIAHGNATIEGEIQNETVWFRLVRTGNQGCRRRRRANIVGVGGTCPVASVCRFRRSLVRQWNGFALGRLDGANPLSRGLQGQWYRAGLEADPALRQR